MLESGYFDSDLYDGNGTQKNKYDNYVTSIPNDDEDEEEDDDIPINNKRTTGFGAPAALLNDISRVSLKIVLFTGSRNSFPNLLIQAEKDYDPFADRRRPTVGEKEDEYRQKRRKLVISPERVDPFADGMYLFKLLHLLVFRK